MCSSVVPQHPPSDVREAALGELAQVLRAWSRGARRSRRTRSADRRSGGRSVNTGAIRASDSTYGRISAAPSAQFTPTLKRLGVRDRAPERLDRLTGERPPAPVGDRDADHQRDVRRDVARAPRWPPSRSGCRRSSRSAAGRCAAVDEPADLLRVRLGHPVERDRPVRRLVHARGQRERAGSSGPTDPATNRSGPSCVGARGGRAAPRPR